MPPTLTYPGVYIDEIPSGGARPIAAVPTSIAAFVGPYGQGPLDVTDLTSFDDFERYYGRLNTSSPLGVAVYLFFLNGGAQAKVVRTESATPGTPATAVLKLGTAPLDPTLEAKSPGTWGNGIRARVDTDDVVGDPTSTYNLTIKDPANKRMERYANVSTKASAPQNLWLRLANSQIVAASGTLADTSLPKNSLPVDIGKDPFADPVPKSEASYYEVTTEATDGTGLPNYQGAFDKLGRTDTWNLLCVLPEHHPDEVASTALAQAGQLCLERWAFLIVDPPVAWTDVAAVVASWTGSEQPLAGTDFAKSAAVYFPRLTIQDPSPTSSATIPPVAPSGAIAGLYARTDNETGVWKAPAGTTAGFAGVDSFTVPMSDLENGRLNPLGVGCLRTFPGLGNLCWGARTIAGADAELDDPSWRYVPIRRTALMIEQSLYIGTKWVVFMPNDEPLWSAVRLSVGGFMSQLWRQGAFQGRTQKEAFLVKCDAGNNPQADIDRGIVNILVGFAPLKPAEFVVINIQQVAPGLA